MRTVDRQGVHIEQCENCRGIFLDHGELEQMLTAENRFYGAAPYVPPGGHRGKPDSPRPYRGGHSRFAAPLPRRPPTPTRPARTGTASTRASSATCSG